MGRYIRKNPNGDEGQRSISKQEEKVLKAWNRGERTAEEIAEAAKAEAQKNVEMTGIDVAETVTTDRRESA